jgi:hypothetical protein
MNDLQRTIERLKLLNWDDVEQVSEITQQTLLFLSQPYILHELINNMLKDKALLKLCEHYDFFDKFVLYREGQNRFRIRLHIFLEDSHKDRPHHHRWIYSSLILKGEYIHSLYGCIDDFSQNPIQPGRLKPFLVQKESLGSHYTLTHNIIHAVDALPCTVTLFIRGPVLRTRFMIFDKQTGMKWWEYGRESETIEETKKKIMNASRIDNQIENLHKWRLI